MRESADRGDGIVEHDRDAAPEADGEQDLGFPTDLEVGDPDQHFFRLHAGLRYTRSRGSTSTSASRAVPNSVSTLPRTR